MLVGLLVGVFGFQFLLEKLNNLDIKWITKLQEKTRDMKHKKGIQYSIMIIGAGLIWGMMDMIGIMYLVQGLIVGLFWAWIRFLFEDTIYDGMRNTLR